MKKNFKYAVGEIVYTKYGKGTVHKIDPKDKHFTYFVKCEDGTDMWCHENDLSNKPIVKEGKESKE